MKTTNKEKVVIDHRETKGKALLHVDVLDRPRSLGQRMTKADRTKLLIARCQRGEPVAFRELFEDTVSGVHRHLSLLIGPGEDVDDLVQLVYLNIFNSIKKFRGQSAFSTWLFRVTINVARQEIRQRGRKKRLDAVINENANFLPVISSKTPEHELHVQQQIYRILDRLPTKKRETFILYMYEGYSLEEIATILGSSVSTIGSRLQSARKEIVRILAGRRTA